MDRRLQHEPVFRILGEREFHGLVLGLNDATLEPRDDTECLIEAVLARLADRHGQWRFLDLGTGTGAIALALLCELPNAAAVAVDSASRALLQARENATANNLDKRATFVESDWFAAVEGSFDFIVSNPPYISSADMLQLDPEVQRYDPPLALDGGEDGLDAYRQILSKAREHLRPGGFLALEIGHDQADQIQILAQGSAWQNISCVKDLAGRDRVLLMD